METQYWLLLIIVALVIGLVINLNRVDKRAQTLAEKWFANVSEPRFYVQRDPTPEAAKSARDEWEIAVKMRQECGNEFIKESDLHLWLWRASEQNEKVEFSAWEAVCEENKRKAKERFIAEKTGNLKGSPAEMAGVVWGEKNEN